MLTAQPTPSTLFKEWPLTLKNVFLPIFCRQCQCPLLTEDNRYFCAACWNIPERIERPFCSVCGIPQKGRVGFGAIDNFPCADCREAKPKPYRRVFAAADYDGAIAETIKLLKFHERRWTATPLSELMIEFAQREMDCDQYDDIVPVPLHKVRLRSRGFNQAHLLAQALLPTFPDAQFNASLKRIRPTRTQSTINDRRERVENVIGAFAVDREEDFSGRTVLLIDDVVTTGGTVSACARALKRAGAETVDVLAAATPAANPSSTPKQPKTKKPDPKWSNFRIA